MNEMALALAEDPRDGRLNGDAVVVNLVWDAAADLDLAALCVKADGHQATLVYFGMRGTRCGMPFVHLAIDHDGGGRRKNRREHLVASNLSIHEAIYLFAWDHDAIDSERSGVRAAGMRQWKATLLDRYNQGPVVDGCFDESKNLVLFGSIKDRLFCADSQSRLVTSRKELLNTISSLVDVSLEVAA